MSKENLQYPPFDKKTGKVICQICGNKYLVISPRHLLKHSISYSDYTKRYPEAPLSSKEFSAKTKYGKVKDLFAPKESDKLEEVIVSKGPSIEDDINIDKILKEKSRADPVKQTKIVALDILRTHFSNVRQDYVIEEYGPMSGRLKYHFISDFADPILKVVIQFPNTFWHNIDAQIDPQKNKKLRLDGWKVLIVKTRVPNIKDIQKVVDEI